MIAKQAAGDYDVVTGTRYRGNGGIYGWSMFRKFTSRVATFLATLAFSPGLSDLTGSYRYGDTMWAGMWPLQHAAGRGAVLCKEWLLGVTLLTRGVHAGCTRRQFCATSCLV